jgi:protein TonB
MSSLLRTILCGFLGVMTVTTVAGQGPRDTIGPCRAERRVVRPSGPRRVGSVIVSPTLVTRVEPVYPAEALSARVQGIVIVEARIDTKGKVTDARVLRSIPLLDQAALDAVKQWVYAPTCLNGAAIPVIAVVTVPFKLP